MAEWKSVCKAEVIQGGNGTVTFSEHPTREFLVIAVTDKDGRTASVNIDRATMEASSLLNHYVYGFDIVSREPLIEGLARALRYTDSQPSQLSELEAAIRQGIADGVRAEMDRQRALGTAPADAGRTVTTGGMLPSPDAPF